MKRALVAAIALVLIVPYMAANAHTGAGARLGGDGHWKSKWGDSPDPRDLGNQSGYSTHSWFPDEFKYAENASWVPPGLLVEDVTNLSFDFWSGPTAAVDEHGPQLVVGLDDGTSVVLPAVTCNQPLGLNQLGQPWSRADFTGGPQACPVHVALDEEGVQFGTYVQSYPSWSAFAAVHPTQVVIRARYYVNSVIDRRGHNVVDDIAMLTHMQVGAWKVVHCPTEDSC